MAQAHAPVDEKVFAVGYGMGGMDGGMGMGGDAVMVDPMMQQQVVVDPMMQMQDPMMYQQPQVVVYEGQM